MRAVVCREYGPPEKLVIEERASPEPGAGQVLIAVRAAGVNFPDTLIIDGKYQIKPPLPFSPGSEAAGIVKAIGAGVTTVAPGDHVVALAPFGGYAEELIAGEAQVVPMPPGLDFARAACALTTYGTSWHALVDRAALRAGETLLVLGAAGGVGLAAVELGKQLGARVIAAASSAARLETCRQSGADELIDYSREDLKDRVKALTRGNGVDVVYDPIGGALSETALRVTGWGGRFLVIGFAAGEIPKIPANLVLLKGSAMVGVFWGAWLMREPARARAAHVELLTWIRDGKLAPHLHARYPLVDAARALRDLLERKIHGKAVLET
jgi:NADPH2:quinone reductase